MAEAISGMGFGVSGGEGGAVRPLDRQAFLRLLVTELRYQNPFSPMDNREFVTQLAQFSLLEQLEALNRKVEEITTQLAAIRALLGTGGGQG